MKYRHIHLPVYLIVRTLATGHKASNLNHDANIGFFNKSDYTLNRLDQVEQPENDHI